MSIRDFFFLLLLTVIALLLARACSAADWNLTVSAASWHSPAVRCYADRSKPCNGANPGIGVERTIGDGDWRIGAHVYDNSQHRLSGALAATWLPEIAHVHGASVRAGIALGGLTGYHRVRADAQDRRYEDRVPIAPLIGPTIAVEHRSGIGVRLIATPTHSIKGSTGAATLLFLTYRLD